MDSKVDRIAHIRASVEVPNRPGGKGYIGEDNLQVVISQENCC